MSIAVSLILVVFFLLMNAFFVIAEFAMVRVRKSQIELAYDEGKRGAKNAKTITENVNAYLSACQLGITLASLALGWLGEPAISALIRPLFVLFGLPDAVISVIAVAIGYFLMTTLHVVVGELIPKSFAIFATGTSKSGFKRGARRTSKGNPPHSLNLRTNTLTAADGVSPMASAFWANRSFSSESSFTLMSELADMVCLLFILPSCLNPNYTASIHRIYEVLFFMRTS